MGAPVVQVLWVTSGTWAVSRETAAINKSETNRNRTAVFIFSPLEKFALRKGSSLPLRLIDLDVVVDDCCWTGLLCLTLRQVVGTEVVVAADGVDSSVDYRRLRSCAAAEV